MSRQWRALRNCWDRSRARDVPVGPMTTYRVGGAADLFVRLTARDQIPTVAAALNVSGLPLLVIGRGSNLLVADAGFRGIALSIAEICNDIEIDTETSTVTAGSGVLLPVLARRVASAGLTGFEWAVGVPGSVGGAVRMNAGGHGSDMSESLTSVTLADLADDQTVTSCSRWMSNNSGCVSAAAGSRRAS